MQHSYLCPRSTQSGKDKTQAHERRGSVPTELYKKATGQMWPTGRLPYGNEIAISTLTQENRPSRAHWWNIRPDAVLTEGTTQSHSTVFPAYQLTYSRCSIRGREGWGDWACLNSHDTLTGHGSGEAETANECEAHTQLPRRSTALYICPTDNKIHLQVLL